MRIDKPLNDAISRLAALITNGELIAATDPAKFVHMVADEIERLRDGQRESTT